MNKVTSQHTVIQRLQALRQLMAKEEIRACILPTGDPHMSEYISDHYMSRSFMTGFTDLCVRLYLYSSITVSPYTTCSSAGISGTASAS